MGPAKLNENDKIPIVNLDLSQLFFVANAATGKGGKNTLHALATLLLSAASAPVKTYGDIDELLANTNLLGNFFAFVSNAEDDPNVGEEAWALYLFVGGDSSDMNNYRLIQKDGGIGGGDLTNLDGGSAASEYLVEEEFDGGNA